MDMRTPPHLFARGGVWYVRKVVRGVKLRASTGVAVGGQAELKKAIKRQREIEDEWDRITSGGKSAEIPTFGEWWSTYNTTYSVQKARPKADRVLVGYALEKWKRVRLTHITKSMCEHHLQTRLKAVSQGSVSRERGLLQAIFQRAIEDQLLERNPFQGIKRITDRVRDRVLSVEEQAKVMAVSSPQFQRWFTMMIGTGLRLEESRAVLPEHLDRTKRVLAVQAHAAKYKKARLVPLYPLVEEAIDAQWTAMGRLWSANAQNYRGICARAAELAEIPHFSPHTLRHTFATRYLQAGGNIFYLSKILGHASVTLTERQYVHLAKTDVMAASLRLDLGLLTTPPPATGSDGGSTVGPTMDSLMPSLDADV